MILNHENEILNMNGHLSFGFKKNDPDKSVVIIQNGEKVSMSMNRSNK